MRWPYFEIFSIIKLDTEKKLQVLLYVKKKIRYIIKNIYIKYIKITLQLDLT